MENQPLCNWCNKVQAGKLLNFGLISHGICQDCAERQVRDLEISQLNAMWHAPSKPEDSLGAARGIVSGFIFSLIAWALIWGAV